MTTASYQGVPPGQRKKLTMDLDLTPPTVVSMKRRRLLRALGVLGLAALVPGCGRAAAPLRIATNPWIGYEFLFLARREGWISPQEVELLETGSATECIALLAEGKADGAALTLDEMLGARQRGLPLIAVLVFDISMGADVLLVRPSILSLAQLKGKRIGYEPSAVGALMLHKALEAGGLKPEEIIPVRTPFDHHPRVWQTGEVDALITFEPVSSRLRAQDARRLFDSSQIPNTIVDVMAVFPHALERNPEALRRLVASHFEGLHRFRKNPNDVAYRMAERFKLPAQEVLGAYRGLELPNETRNRKLLGDGDASITRVAEALFSFLTQAAILENRPIDLSRLANAGFIPREEMR